MAKASQRNVVAKTVISTTCNPKIASLFIPCQNLERISKVAKGTDFPRASQLKRMLGILPFLNTSPVFSSL